MKAPIPTHNNPSGLYEQDYYLWLNTTIKQLRDHAFEQLDLEQLIEEIEGLTRSEKRELRRCARGWRNTIRDQRRRIHLLLKDSPSLKPLLSEIFADCYLEAREDAIEKTELASQTFPKESPFTLEQILDLDYVPSRIPNMP